MSVKRIPGPGEAILKDAIKSLGNTQAAVGWFPSAKYPDGQSVAAIAQKNEFGLGVPARPFMRPTIRKRRNAWKDTIKDGATQVLKGNENAVNVLTRVGIQASADIKSGIKAVHTPPLSPVTIKRRLERRSSKIRTAGIDKPLIDTGLMIATVNYEVTS